MKNLILISFLAILFSGCHISLCHSWYKDKGGEVKRNLNSYFSNPDSSYLYLAEIRFLKNYYSGIVVIKPQNEDLHRVVFMTEMGVKIFDYEISNPIEKRDFYKIHYILEPLSRKIIKKTFANDFGSLLLNPKKSNRTIYTNKSGEQIVKIKNRSKRYFYVFTKDSEKFNKIQIEKCLQKKAELVFWGEDNAQPDSVQINHIGLKLNYTFRKLKQ